MSAAGLSLLIGLAAWQSAGASSARVTDLRCEYLTDPLGIDLAHPRLSWRLDADGSGRNALHQTAYQVLVATSQKLLNEGQSDLWNSGTIDSTESVNVAYSGKPLQSSQECFWKIRFKDQDGRWSGWSRPARWTVGLLTQADWKGKWIGTDKVYVKGQGWPPPDNTMPDPWLRKTFDLGSKPARAVAYVASVGYHELYVNGRKVSDAVLLPSTTDHKHRARYVTYEIAPFLKPGRNVIGLWLGTSWSIFPYYKTTDKPASPIVLAQVEIDPGKAGSQQVVTDETWKTHPSPNTLLGVWDFMHYGGELYDANKEMPDWCEVKLDDSAWRPVSVFQPQLRLSADRTNPNRLVHVIKPVGIIESTNGMYRIDMGVNYAGWFEMELSGAPGDRIDFQFSERADEAMTHRLHSAYILGPSGKGKFRNHFNYGSGRWVQVKGLKAKPSLGQIRGWLVRPDYARAGGFECDQPLLNRIYETTAWTFENLSLGNYVVDCPQRERMGYGGDAHATTRTGLDTYDLGAFYTKWIEDWRDAQGTDGNLPYTSPTYWGGGGPGWSGFCITLPWEMFQQYGDRRILEENFPMMQRWLGFLETKAKDCMLVRWGGEWDFLGDWLWPGAKGVNGDTKETLFFNNCYWIYNLRTAAKIADALGDREAAERYRKRAAEVAAAVHATFFNAADNSYVNGFPAYLAFALLTDVPPQDLRGKVWQRLEQEILVNRKGHIHAGITGGAFLFKTLIENKRSDLIYPMVSKEDYPGWGDMLKRAGATTFYEDWDLQSSYLHSSYLYVGAWFIESLGGIRPGPEGSYRHFTIQPWIDWDTGPRAVKTHYDSVYGRIVSDWKVAQGKLSLSVTVPPNTVATVKLDRVDPRSVAAVSKTGAQQIADENGAAVLRLQPGRHEITASK